MSMFHDFLTHRLETSGFSTEDALASFLPLVRETLEAHAADCVAPLDGLEALHVDGVKIWFEEARRLPIRREYGELRRVEAASLAAVEIIAEARRSTEVDEGSAETVDLAIGKHDQEITRPVYLPGYVTWEQQLGHHDPLTDVFSLGMILASLACGLDFTEPRDLEVFVAHRRNLFALTRDLHPVLAQAIVRMTELDRHRRAQDLTALLRALENYRDQDFDIEFDLARIDAFRQIETGTKQSVVLAKLRERLFEVSRRNRLLHFQPSMQSVNLTHASVPLSFDIKNIRNDQILVWNDSFQKQLVSDQPVSLNKYLNFAEALYLPSVLDRIMADARRDQAEFGFAQLRLALCFLHWANLKEQPIVRYDSPLVLLPVVLKKKKGIRDTYFLQAITAEAEINPVVRFQLKQLYDIDLPESIDLSATTLDELYEFLSAKVSSSHSVALKKIDRPRIALIHDKARRKLDQYRRRARLAGRGVRSYMDLDYSYDPANYHPLGIKLFAAKVRPQSTHLREIIEEKPRPRRFAAPDREAESRLGSDPVEKERTFFSLQEGSEENPYAWTFDLCSVTLANFKYRKMSLVRDYDALLQEPRSNPAFDATFSLVPRPVERSLQSAPPLDDRYDVVPCDPTQATAIEEARAGKSYIIQGPPGTGKSQTITNLIADYVARGQRVLFVCEKRAAIDVVFARLRQCGLSDLCCLIHDSQTDKKQFVMDLKQTYETCLGDGDLRDQEDAPPSKSTARRSAHASHERSDLLTRIKRELRPLEQFDAVMQSTPDSVRVPLRRLLDRCIELQARRPQLSSLEQERLPGYSTWLDHRESIDRFAALVSECCADGVFANHALRLLSPRITEVERSLELVALSLEAADKHFDSLEGQLVESDVSQEHWSTLAEVRELIQYANDVSPLARIGQLGLLDTSSQPAQRFTAAMASYEQRTTALKEAQQATTHWKQKLLATELPAALEQARLFEGKLLAWLHPAWWRLRGILNRCYDFRAHVVRPSWTSVLTALLDEYNRAVELEHQGRTIVGEFGGEGNADEFVENVRRLQRKVVDLPNCARPVHAMLLNSDDAAKVVKQLVAAGSALNGLVTELSKIADGFDEQSLGSLRTELDAAVESLDDLPDVLDCLTELAGMPDDLAAAFRNLRLTPEQIESAVADHSLDESLRRERQVSRFTAATRDRHATRLERLYDTWLTSNAAQIRERVRHRFLEHVRVAGLPAAQLTSEQKEFKKRYNRGRQELEHEFGKSMRYKSIRDLVSGDSGEIVKDLKPVWLMSPLSVSDTLPLDTAHVDVVIFDEASQVTLEEAVPSIFRAEQTIVVGDEMQLPPTDFFSAKRPQDEDELLIEEEGELIQYDLDAGSFLSHAAKNLAATMLGWHYRSRSESLISFSNWMFYEGRLLTVPEENLPAPNQQPLNAVQAEDAETAIRDLLERPISLHFMEHGIYDKRRNRAEAEYIARLVHGLLLQSNEDDPNGRSATQRVLSHPSIGVIAFSEAQQNEIEAALARLAQEDAAFRDALDAERERVEDGQFIGLLVKNLENIQGDERDIVILSICYGYNPHGKMLMNFGPINKSGGEKRLNVAFSRAKHHIAIVSSIRDADITNEYNDGANCLKNYLRYADAVSCGNAGMAARVLGGISRWHDPHGERSTDNDPVSRQLTEALRERGFEVQPSVGQSHFRCDLAVRRPGDMSYRLGILIDNDNYYDQSELLERDVMRPRLLRNFGWNVSYVLAKDWYDDRDAVLQRLLRRLAGVESPETELDHEDDGDTSLFNDKPQAAVFPVPDDASDSSSHEAPFGADSLADSPPSKSPASQPTPIAGSDDKPVSRYFEFIGGSSKKFWEITISGSQHTVRFGRIGTAGQSNTKNFDDAATAKRDSERLIRQKLSKGYNESGRG